MKECRFTLLTDGPADTALIPPITWLLHQKLPDIPVQIEWADLTRLSKLPKGLVGRVQAALNYYPCDILLVHRDSESESREKRETEIHSAMREAPAGTPFVCVVTVKMQEAWMLIDEDAIRTAAGNPNGDVALHLPKLREIENLTDPKTILHELLRNASELTGRRLKKFSAPANAHRVAELIEDWKPLRKLSAFVEFENELNRVLAEFTSRGRS